MLAYLARLDSIRPHEDFLPHARAALRAVAG